MIIPDEFKNRKILIVDDEPTIRELSRAFLREIGFIRITVVGDGTQALSRLKKESFDLIICDWIMPGLSGMDVFNQVREDPAIPNIPFLMVTASTEIRKVKEAIHAGVSGYIAKPFQPNTLYQKVLTLLAP